MAEKILQTRLQLKYDTYSNWTSNNPVLKAGEMAIATVASNQTNLENTGFTNLPNIVLKVGDGVSHYNDLKFVSALAADVHSWAKGTNKPTYYASEIEGLDEFIAGEIENTDTQYTIVPVEGATYKFELKSKGLTDAAWDTVTEIDLSEIDARLDALEEKVGNKKVSEQIAEAINVLNAAEVKAGQGEIIESVTETAGVVTVTKRALVKEDIPTIEQNQVNGLNDSLTAAAKAGTDAAAQALADAKAHTEAAVQALDNADAAVDNQFVTAVHEVDGIVTVERAQATIANIKDLEGRLSGIEGNITNLGNDKQDNLGFEGEYNKETNKVVTKSALTGAIEALDYAGGEFGTHKFATKVTETDGIVSVQYAQPVIADINGLPAEIERLDGRINTKQDALTFTSTPNSSDNRVATEKFVLESVADLNGAMHFVGALDSIPTDNSQYEAGDVILVGYDEYVFDGNNWLALGNESIYAKQDEMEKEHERLEGLVTALSERHDQEMETLEKKHDNELAALDEKYTKAIEALDFTDTAVAKQFVTAVSETDGVISVNRRALSADDIPVIEQTQVNGLSKALTDLTAAVGAGSEATLTAAKTYADNKVTTSIQALDFADAAVAKQFVTAVSETDGVIAVTRRGLEAADIPVIEQTQVNGLANALAGKETAGAAAQALTDAKAYADTKVQTSIGALDYVDTEVANNVVTAVNETDGVIAVTRKPLADIAWSGEVKDLKQTDTIIVFNCGNSQVGTANEYVR